MKALIVLALPILLAASVVAAYSSVNVAEVTAAVSRAPVTEPARLLLCGAALLMLSVALRRATFVIPKR